MSHGVGLTQDVETEVVLGIAYGHSSPNADESTRSMIGDAISKRMDSSAETTAGPLRASQPDA